MPVKSPPAVAQHVRNLTKGPLVYSTDVAGGEVIKWEGAGSETKDDVQLVGPDIFSSRAFQQLLRKGRVEVLDEETAQRYYDGQIVSSPSERLEQDATEAIINPDDKSLVMVSCTAPKPGKANEACGEMVTMSLSTLRAGKEPRCEKHQD